MGGLIRGIRKKCFGSTRQNVSDKRIKAKVPLHFELGGLISGYIRMGLYAEQYIRWQIDGLVSGGGGLKPGGALKWDFMVL